VTAALADTLLPSASNARHGVVQACQSVAVAPADVPGVHHAVVPGSRHDDWGTAAGGAGRTGEAAECAAIGEAMERYAASVARLERAPRSRAGQHRLDLEDFSLFSPAQRRHPDFPYGGLYEAERVYARAYSMDDNAEWWVPPALVALTDAPAISTSNGLATASSAALALLRGVQEVIERDALMVTWLHSVRSRRVALPDEYVVPVAERGGELVCVDATPGYSPWPVAVVGGMLPLRGRPRFAMGAACRETWEAAVEKAFLEWAQGTVFVSAFLKARPDLEYGRADDVRTFQDHAAYYSVRASEWDPLPIWKGQEFGRRAWDEVTLQRGVEKLSAAGVRLFYRDLTPVDLRQLGLWTVRVLSPDLTPLHFHEPWAFLGGRTADVTWRYPWARAQHLRFPNPMPHPLG
jgi:ribosomal protein S12 methylthiotransferase accessory factor